MANACKQGYPVSMQEAPSSTSSDAIAELARRALDALPAELRGHLEDVVLKVREFADEETLGHLEIDDRWDLTGLYEGRPLPEQSVWSSGDLPPVITLFRQPLLREHRETGTPLEELVTHVLIHEAGHHFGFSDDDMAAIENEDGYDDGIT